MKHIHHSTTLWFGKHAGKDGAYLLDHNPGYLVWLSENAKDIKVQESLLANARAEACKRDVAANKPRQIR